MSKKITWWPASFAKDFTKPMIVLMRYDWPDERVYQMGLYVPGFFPWTDGHGGMLQTPDYFTAEDITRFIKIPAGEEFTYMPKEAQK